MSSVHRLLLTLLVGFMPASASAAAGFNLQIVEDATVRVPEPGSEESHVGPGDAIYSELHQKRTRTMTTFAVLRETFSIGKGNKVHLAPGTRLGNFLLKLPGQPMLYMRCSVQHTVIKETLLSGPVYKKAACFTEVQGALRPVLFKGYRPEPSLDTKISFDIVSEETSSTIDREGRFELLYQGAGGGVLRLMYREFTGKDLARPAFSQEVTYDLQDGGPTSIVFKGASIKVISAKNSGIRYIIEHGFDF